MVVFSVFIVCLTLLAGTAAYLLVRHAVRSAKQEIRETVLAFVQPAGEGEPSPLASIVDNMSQILANRITASVKGSLMGTASGVARALDGAQSDLLLDGISQRSPMVGALLDLSPSLRKRVGKMNPMAAMMLSQMASGLGKPAGGPGGPQPLPANNGSGTQSVMGL